MRTGHDYRLSGSCCPHLPGTVTLSFGTRIAVQGAPARRHPTLSLASPVRRLLLLSCIVFLSLKWSQVQAQPCPVIGQNALELDLSKIPMPAEKSSVLIIGEWHGSKEMPRVISSIACKIIAMHRSVQVALEVSADWSDDLNRYVNAQTIDPAVRDRLSSRWNATRISFPDGRTSEAMWQLIESLRLSARSHPGLVSVVAFDTRQWEPPLKGDRRAADLGMATTLVRAVEAASPAVTIVLTGELHARLLPDTSVFKPQPMAYLMTLARPGWNIVSLKAQADGGEVWACVQECGPWPHRNPTEYTADSPLGLGLHDKMNQQGFHGAINVGTFSASPPYDPVARATRPEIFRITGRTN